MKTAINPTLKVEAINKKHQRTVNVFVRANAKYDTLVNQEKEETAAGYNAYEKALDAWEELPKREQDNICKHIDGVRGSYYSRR